MVHAHPPHEKPQLFPIVDDDSDRMILPLYHGTSSLFLQSIRSDGLGAIDPHAIFRTRELLAELASARDWGSELHDTDLFIEQKVTAGGFNFRHGRTYLSPSEITAVRYALNNRYGSELLTRTLQVFDMLKEHDVDTAHDIIAKYPEIREINEMPHYPILVEAFGMPIGNLLSEQGEDPYDTLRVMHRTLEQRYIVMASNEHNDIWQQFNFELIAPYSANNLDVFGIDTTRAHSVFPEYNLMDL